MDTTMIQPAMSPRLKHPAGYLYLDLVEGAHMWLSTEIYNYGGSETHADNRQENHAHQNLAEYNMFKRLAAY